MRYTDAELSTICWQELGRTAGSSMDDGNLTQNRRQAIEYYLTRRPEGPDIPGRSQVVSPDVRNAITNLQAEMANLWAGEYPCEFEPEGPGDEQQAELETYAVRQVIEKADLDEILCGACFDSMLLKNGIIKAWCEDLTQRETRKFEGLTQPELTALMADLPEQAEIQESGDTTTIVIPYTEKRVRIEAIDPTNFLISQATRSLDVEKARFMAERKFITRSELRQMGVKKSLVDKLPAFSYDKKEDSYTRRLDYTTADESAETRDQDKCEVFEAYLNIDMDGEKGISDRWRILFCDRYILDKEKVNYVPYVAGCVLPFPHRFEGVSIFDLTKESQDIGTAATRQWLDNNATGVQNRLIVNGKAVNIEDLEAAGPNRHIRMTRGDDVRAAVQPVPYQDVGASIAALIDYKNQLRREATGASIDMHGDEQQIMSNQVGSLGADRIMSSQEQVAAMFLRNFSTSIIKGLFLLVHRALREDYDEAVMVRAGDQWVQQDPRMWRPRHAVAVRAGMSTGERNRKVGSLTTQLQVQMQLMGSGSPMASPQNVYALLMDLARAQELESAEQYYTDPMSEQYQMAAQQIAEQAQAAQQMQGQMETFSDQVKLTIAQLQDATDRLKIAADIEIEEAKIVGAATTDLSIAQIQAESAAANQGGDAGNRPAANGSGQG